MNFISPDDRRELADRQGGAQQGVVGSCDHHATPVGGGTDHQIRVEQNQLGGDQLKLCPTELPGTCQAEPMGELVADRQGGDDRCLTHQS